MDGKAEIDCTLYNGSHQPHTTKLRRFSENEKFSMRSLV